MVCHSVLSLLTLQLRFRDRVRMHYQWSGPLHYVSPLLDHPPDHCSWNSGVKNERNVLNAVLNYTARVQSMRQDEDLRFLIQ